MNDKRFRLLKNVFLFIIGLYFKILRMKYYLTNLNCIILNANVWWSGGRR